MAFAGLFEICISEELFEEYHDVLNRARLKLPPATVVQALSWFRANAVWVRPAGVVMACSDPDDDMVLACAQEGRANFLVTGNVIDFPSRWGKIKIVTPRQFVDEIKQAGAVSLL